jgi:hypothetical protein
MVEKCKDETECSGMSGPSFPDIPTSAPIIPLPEVPEETPGEGGEEPTSPGCAPETPESIPPGCLAGIDGSLGDFENGEMICPPSSGVGEFTLSGGNENCFISDIVDESLQIAGAEINIYKLLGVHEQGRLVDCTGHGQGISGGELPGYVADNAFTKYKTQWRSIQRGPGVLASAYIGYDFGEIKTNDFSRNAYGTETFVMKHINAISIKQSEKDAQRVTEARIERSFDGKKWYGVARIAMPDDDCLNTIIFADSVPARYWRIRPIKFNGGNNDRWVVSAIQMFHEYAGTETHNIQDKVFLENRDRDYDTDSQLIKGYYDLFDSTTELGKFGIELPSQSIYISVSFSRCVQTLGRPIVIGDIIEIPSEAMYSSKMRRVEKWLEIIDVAWSTEGYTPGWNPTMLRVIAQPAYASQETQDIFGDLASYEVENGVGLVDQETGKDPAFQDYFDASQTMFAEARDAVPQRGVELSSTIREWEQEEIEKSKETVIDENGRQLQLGIKNLSSIGMSAVGNAGYYGESAMPPNNAPFSESDEWPERPKHGDYHRLTYSKISTTIPARLFRYSEVKGRWVYMETDRRHQFGKVVPMLQEFAEDPRSRPGDEIARDAPLNRQRIRKSCDVLPSSTIKNEKPPETKDGTKDFKVNTTTRSNNTLKPMEKTDPTANNPGSCPDEE